MSAISKYAGSLYGQHRRETGAFYTHFADKYALLESWIREKFHRALERQLPASSTLQNQHAGEAYPIYLLQLPVTQVLTQWEVLRNLVPETSYWPIIALNNHLLLFSSTLAVLPEETGLFKSQNKNGIVKGTALDRSESRLGDEKRRGVLTSLSFSGRGEKTFKKPRPEEI